MGLAVGEPEALRQERGKGEKETGLSSILTARRDVAELCELGYKILMKLTAGGHAGLLQK